MKVFELIEKIRITKIKINELSRELKVAQSDDLTVALLAEIDQLQNYKIALERVNNSTTTKIGKTEASIAALVIIRNANRRKIRLLTELISLEDKRLDVLSLIEQRDYIFSECLEIERAITISDLSTEVE